jgi:hypothetical protein
MKMASIEKCPAQKRVGKERVQAARGNEGGAARRMPCVRACVQLRATYVTTYKHLSCLATADTDRGVKLAFNPLEKLAPHPSRADERAASSISRRGVLSMHTCEPEVLRLAAAGRCPSSRWKDVIAPLLLLESNSRGLTFVNAGANKGFAVSEFLQRFWTPFPTSREWGGNATKIKPSLMHKCGFCGDCSLPPPSPALRAPSVTVHAFELLASNAKLLSLLFERFAVPGEVHSLALSSKQAKTSRTLPRPQGGRAMHYLRVVILVRGLDNPLFTDFTGSAYRPFVARTGQENAAASTVHARWTERVGTTSVDAFATSRALERVDWLALDAEGWDPIILRGARRMLSERRISIVEFEYTPSAWARAVGAGVASVEQPSAAAGDGAAAVAGAKAAAVATDELVHTLAMLRDSGYTCFWQGGRRTGSEAGGALAPVRRSLGCDTVRLTGNVLCAHAPTVVAKLEGLALTAETSQRESRPRVRRTYS